MSARERDSKLLAILPEKNKYMNLVWQVSDICNFRCSYCNEGNWGGKSPNLNTELYIEKLEKIIMYYEQMGYNSFKFFFSGGEPARWPPLLDIAKYLHERIDAPLLAVNTNLNSPTKWWKKNYHYFQDVVASFHIEFANKDLYLENAKFLQDKVNYLALRMMMHKNHFNEVIEFSKTVRQSLDNYHLEFVPILAELTSSAEPYEYTEDWQMKFFEKNSYEHEQRRDKTFKPFNVGHSIERYIDNDGNIFNLPLNSNRLLANHKNYFKGWKCWINESLFININGDISAATCGAHEKLGNINDKDINFLTEPVICPKNYCSCGTDMLITKESPDYNQEES